MTLICMPEPKAQTLSTEKLVNGSVNSNSNKELVT